MKSCWNHSSQCVYMCLCLCLVLSEVQALDVQPAPDSQSWSASSYDQRPSISPSMSQRHLPAPPAVEELQLEEGAADVFKRADETLDSKAYHRLPNGSGVGSAQRPRFQQATAMMGTTNRQEVEALISFKAGLINSGDLSLHGNWNTNDSTPCGWVGVLCSASLQRVTTLSLGGYQLEGSINSALVSLSRLWFLSELDLSNNSFGSFLSGPALLNFSSLAFMNFSYNQIEGEIPDQLGELTNLQLVALQFNNLTGSIPLTIGNCTLLRVLNLQANLLQGDIPWEIGGLIHLEELDLSNYVDRGHSIFGTLGNDLSGSIPLSLGNCSSLVVLNLDYNSGLGGEIPQELSHLESLQLFSSLGCSLSGVFPRWIGNLTNLIEIHLTHNKLHGPVPSEIGKLHHLSWLAAGYMDLTGDFPSEIENCTSLTRLRFPYTLITGIIPEGIGNLSLLRDINFGGSLQMAPALIPPWLSSMEQLEIITLDDTNRRGRIPGELGKLFRLTTLSLADNSLIGSIPSSLSNCTLFTLFLVDDNNLTGNLPSEIGALVNLRNLVVSYNSLTGLIPISINNLTMLTDLEVDHNSFTGTIDTQWRLPLLNGFMFAYNLFVGSIPTALSNCSALREFIVEGNHLTGIIPASFGNLSDLQQIRVANNFIRGNIPADLARCDRLTKMDLSSNNLDGLLPPELGHLFSLTTLNLSHNKLTSTLPSSVGNLSHVIWIDISYNCLNGSVPWESLSSLHLMLYINISHNFLSGLLSADWSNLPGLSKIDVSANLMSGTIPNLQSLRSLQYLDLSQNNFSGIIPNSLALLPRLVFFNASYNNFEGPIPTFSMPGSNVTIASFLGNPGLCGAVLGLPQECQDNASSPKAKCENFQCARTWIPVSVAGIAFTLVCFATAACFMKRGKAGKEEFDIVLNFGQGLPSFSPLDILDIIRTEENVIGSTADSIVYKGSLPGSDSMIAIKTFVGHDRSRNGVDQRVGNPDQWQRVLEQEANIQASLRHRNVLKLLTFCSHISFRALLLEYMPQGSLHSHLYPRGAHVGMQLPQRTQGEGGLEVLHLKQNCELPWTIRLSIAIDIANGMTYLHHECPEPLIHGDLKPSNILLDEEMVAKVSDFGISKLVNLQQDGEVTVSQICGTIGYMPPEYASVTIISTKGDVFSYGVLLLEMLSGNPPSGTDVSAEANCMGSNLQRIQEKPMDALDLTLQHEGKADVLKYKQMMLMAKVAYFCTRESPQSRPSMKDVRTMLLQIKGLDMEAVPRPTIIELAQETENLGSEIWESADQSDC